MHNLHETRQNEQITRDKNALFFFIFSQLNLLYFAENQNQNRFTSPQNFKAFQL